MKLLFWLVILLVALALALFAVSNRATTTLGFWPLPAVVEAPLYLAILTAMLIGFVIGASTAWLAGGPRRREARRRRRRLVALERELAATQAQLPGAMASGSASGSSR
jgi:uncharacterized integral membrane protein